MPHRRSAARNQRNPHISLKRIKQMKKHGTTNLKQLFASATSFLSLSLILLLAACSSGSIGTTSVLAVGANSAAKVTLPVISSGLRACPPKVASPAYWDPIIGTSGDAKVESVSRGKIKVYTGIQALVTVRHHSSGSVLDVYVYANILNPQPTQFFNLPGLIKGDASISGYNTVLTAEVAGASSVQNIFREFKWSDGAGAFEQTSFPGMFPDMTRYQAEADQQKVNHGHDLWKLDALKTTRHALSLFRRDPLDPVTLVSGGGTHDVNAVVNVAAYPGGSGAFAITVNLSRLEGNKNGGIWEVTAVMGDQMFLPSNLGRLHSPATITGYAPLFEGQAGVVTILDGLYNNIGFAIAMGSPFSVSVPHTSTFHNGYQEGIVALYYSSGATTPYMVKALIGA